jgi:alpha-maltose-1-phosphate synthase
MIQLNHPTGNANVRHVLHALHQNGLLSGFWTTVASSPTNQRWLPRRLGELLKRRSYDFLPSNKINTIPWREACRVLLPFGNKLESGPFSIDAVFQEFDSHVANNLNAKSVKYVYSYEDSALKTFQKATSLGIGCIYDLPVGYWKQAYYDYAEESELQPQWREALIGLNDSEAKKERKTQEIHQASVVFVPSTYTARTLTTENIKGEILINPFGSPPACHIDESPGSDTKGPLKVLFVGSVQQRKGISYMFDAVESLAKHVSLTIVGSVPSRFPLIEAHLAKHQYYNYLPHNELLPLMRQHDVLILPSISDGFGLVILEALSQGLPVIASENTGGPDVITGGVNGWVVPIRSSEAIRHCLEKMLSDRQNLTAMRYAALQFANTNSWDHYEKRLLNALSRFIDTDQSVAAK